MSQSKPDDAYGLCTYVATSRSGKDNSTQKAIPGASGFSAWGLIHSRHLPSRTPLAFSPRSSPVLSAQKTGAPVAVAVRGAAAPSLPPSLQGEGAPPSKEERLQHLQMDKMAKLLTYVAAAHLLLSMMAMVIESRKRKRATPREIIRYGPIDERDRMRFEYLNTKIWKNDVTCVNMLRLNKASFFRFCNLLRERGSLRDTIHMCVEQQVAMFLNIVGHNLKNRLVGTNYDRSGETVSRYFNKVLHAIGELQNELIRLSSSTTPTKIAGNPRWDPYFKDCIGAIDGTHVRASVSKDMEAAFCGRKTYATQNVMAAVDFDLRFTYVLAGWEGTAHDALVLRDALEREHGLRVPQGKFYLVDAGYGAKPGFLSPFRGVRYHLNEWGNNPVQNEKELFNLRHSSLRVTVERAFGSLKRRFKILDDATPYFPFTTQVEIVVACCIIHNWVIQDGSDEFIIPEQNWMPTYSHASSSSGQEREHTFMVNFRQEIANRMWEDRQNHYADPYVATGQYARGSNEPLGTAGDDIEEIQGEDTGAAVTADDGGATSSATRPNKRAEIVQGNADGLVAAFDCASERLSGAIKEAATADKDMPEGLFDTVNTLPGFEHEHKSFYFEHLVNNPHIARAFNRLPFDHKLTWVAKFVSNNFSSHEDMT
ncbi:hypothetical protein U9M48_001702 [Paspalum notatum var. saurae]|uniref:DDE Tnp4 domain-containing protein n=1 Tax=Paspalum notatum var. saurae TaxID=547442 RepID=A0AAQ3PP19_PASNO